MFQRIRTLFILSFLFAACSTKKDIQVPADEQRALIDSFVKIRLVEEKKQAADQLDHRLSIEVKQKADSIVAARTETTQPTKTDSLNGLPEQPARHRGPFPVPSANDLPVADKPATE